MGVPALATGGDVSAEGLWCRADGVCDVAVGGPPPGGECCNEGVKLWDQSNAGTASGRSCPSALTARPVWM